MSCSISPTSAYFARGNLRGAGESVGLLPYVYDVTLCQSSVVIAVHSKMSPVSEELLQLLGFSVTQFRLGYCSDVL
jgi:hypothetical protein